MEQSGSSDDAFGRFYDATAAAIRAYILRHCSDRDSVDDLFQITYVKFLASRMGTTPDAPEARAYLYRIASNVIADHGRSLQKRNRLEGPEHHVVATEPTTSVAEILALREGLRTLSKREQQMLWLLYAEGFSHKEVAEIMNLRSRSVRVLAFRARKKLSEVPDPAEPNCLWGELMTELRNRRDDELEALLRATFDSEISQRTATKSPAGNSSC